MNLENKIVNEEGRPTWTTFLVWNSNFLIVGMSRFFDDHVDIV